MKVSLASIALVAVAAPALAFPFPTKAPAIKRDSDVAIALRQYKQAKRENDKHHASKTWEEHPKTKTHGHKPSAKPEHACKEGEYYDWHAKTCKKVEHKDEHKDEQDDKPKHYDGWSHKNFDVYLETWASPDQVVNNVSQPVPGLPGASGHYYFALDTTSQTICSHIEFYGFPAQLNYSSPARTATHIHQSDIGRSGPPRIAFTNPQYQADGSLSSTECQTAPFVTGILANGTDTGSASGFTLSALARNASAFNADVHLAAPYLAGAIRGQLYYA